MRQTALVLLSSLFGCLTAAAQDSGPTYFQALETQPSMSAGQTPTVETVSLDILTGGPNPKWIWGPDNGQDYELSMTFEAAVGSQAILVASCDNVGTVLLNGKQVATSNEWQQPIMANVSKRIVAGKNTLVAKVANQGGVAAFVLKLAVKDPAGKTSYVISDTNWTGTSKDGPVKQLEVRGNYGDGPWGDPFASAAAPNGIPRGTFQTLPGFEVQKLFTVPKDELGSWVCITFDDKGRLLASDQGNKGICRITLPSVSASGEAGAASQTTVSKTAASKTTVEHLDFSNCEYKPSGAQGMLWAFDSLYFSCNGGPGSGLYRARDTNGDDQFDECIRLKQFKGGGEHGPHSLRLSPDGKRIFVIAGNHTDPPFQPGEEVDNKNYSSRVPTNWGEDLLLPRMWDANGHARGKLAPGGWIASTDADGKTWDIWSIGFRNPYDMAFNADGELFAYDADMEWDVGLPWYRPTRVVHATSGSEFGWRSGSGKWPDYYIDSLPAMIDIGPGSPVGVDFGYGQPLEADSVAAKNASNTVPTSLDGYVYAPLKFPAKYQKALYICDWTFGTMYAIHTEPNQSTYKATKEEFLSRSPLPLTDCAAGPDGAMYFTIGGRGTQSELYRVVYEGKETLATPVFATEATQYRKWRKKWESVHGGTISFLDATIEVTDEGLSISDGVDPFLVNAGLAAATRPENAPFFRSLLDKTPIDESVGDMYWLAQLATHPAVSEFDDVDLQSMMLNGPAMADKFSSSRVVDKLKFLRALQLCIIRLGTPPERDSARIVATLAPQFPTEDWRVNRELCQLLVYLKSPTVVAKTIELMNQPPQADDQDMADLLARNAGYGRDIKASLKNPPDKQQIWYAYCLRVAETGWTPELRADFYRWFGRAKQWSGGNSYRKYLQNMEDEAWAKTSFDDRVLVEAAGARTPYQPPELPKPIGPGKDWNLEEVRMLAKAGLNNRSFENGQRAFAATRCIVCHRFGEDGGATGPDLTQVAGRFDLKALTEAIMDPSKVISDQYKASTVITDSGKTYTGRIVSENDDQLSVLTDPEDSTKIVDIAKSEIEEMVPSKVSIMPAGLLNSLNQDEILDLLAYMLSRGDEKNSMFKKQ